MHVAIRNWFLLVAAISLVGRARAETLLSEQFVDNPIVAGRAGVSAGGEGRFEYAAGILTAHYDTSLPTAKLSWPLSSVLNESRDFQWDVTANLSSDGFQASPDHFAQIAFGFVNRASTGDDRVGGRGGDAFDLLSVDYFPNVSPLFGGPTLGLTAVGADDGSGYFSQLQFPFGMESGLDDEGPLPLDVALRFHGEYSAEGALLTLRVFADGEPLPLNANQPGIEPGGFDGDPGTIQLLLDPGTAFNVDQFAILLWEDTFLQSGAGPSVQAQWRFSEIVVATPDDGVAGDTNDDGQVDLEDLNNVRNHFGNTDPDSPGDAFPQDGVVDLNDLNLVRNHFGTAASVPEPGSLALLCAIAVGLALYHGGGSFRSK